MKSAMTAAPERQGLETSKEAQVKAGILICIGAIALLGAASPAAGQAHKLTDTELDKVTAGSAANNSSVPTTFSFEGQAGSSHTVKGTGMIAVKEDKLPLPTPAPTLTSNLLLRDNAQQNLRSLVNIVALNSKVQVLINLNVSINSTVGAVHQANSSLGH